MLFRSSKTADCLKGYGLCADVCPSQSDAQGILDVLPQSLLGRSFFLPLAEQANVLLKETLVARGASVTAWSLYETRSESMFPEHFNILSDDIVFFTSGSMVKAFFESDRYQGQPILPVVIGPHTRLCVKKYVDCDMVIAQTATTESMVAALLSRVKESL